MRNKTLIFIAAVLMLITASLNESPAQARRNNQGSRDSRRDPNVENVRLFNGKDLSGWIFYLKDKSVNPAEVFMVRDGVIHITGSPFGYMRTRDTYSDYRLRLEWRWPVEATNSGVFIHSQVPDTIWIKTIECQLAAGNAGDLLCMNGTDMNEHRDKSSIIVKKMHPSSEKPVGEWNTMEVICKSNTIEVIINGILQNKGTGLNVSSGHICLQSEGKDIQFRNVVLTREKKTTRR
jgi:hypothetical protein